MKDFLFFVLINIYFLYKFSQFNVKDDGNYDRFFTNNDYRCINFL